MLYKDLLILGLVLILIFILTYFYEKKKDKLSFRSKQILACATIASYIVGLFPIIRVILHSIDVLNKIW